MDENNKEMERLKADLKKALKNMGLEKGSHIARAVGYEPSMVWNFFKRGRYLTDLPKRLCKLTNIDPTNYKIFEHHKTGRKLIKNPTIIAISPEIDNFKRDLVEKLASNGLFTVSDIANACSANVPAVERFFRKGKRLSPLAIDMCDLVGLNPHTYPIKGALNKNAATDTVKNDVDLASTLNKRFGQGDGVLLLNDKMSDQVILLAVKQALKASNGKGFFVKPCRT